MADYFYEAWHNPPIWMDRVGVRPGEHLAAAFSLVVGAVLLVSTTMPHLFFGIEDLPDVVLCIVGTMLTAGGAASLTGLQWPRSTASVGWYIERIGCLLTGFGWFAAGVVLTQVKPISYFGILVGAFLAAFCTLRFLLLARVEKTSRKRTGKEGRVT